MASEHFYKYQGTGNDFIMFDGRQEIPDFSQSDIAKLCHRRFGIGADGLIILAAEENYDFRMIYYNSDGRESTMCGNGGRCIAQFAHDLGLGNQFKFIAIDGPHKAVVETNQVSLQMIDVAEVNKIENDYFTDTGSPHHVVMSENVQDLEIIEKARAIRYNEHYGAEGVNVNFIKGSGQNWEMRTYERGVEDETYSCGTGVTAAALVAHKSGQIQESPVYMKTKGGHLELHFKHEAERGYFDIWLKGPAKKVFEGNLH